MESTTQILTDIVKLQGEQITDLTKIIKTLHKRIKRLEEITK